MNEDTQNGVNSDPAARYQGTTPLPDEAAKGKNKGLRATLPEGPPNYCFTLSSDISQTFIGEIPGGFRIDLQYGPSQALNCDFKNSRLTDDELSVIEGAQLLSGTDWVSVTSEGIATFDTRITLRVGAASDKVDERAVISASIRGRANLANLRKENGAPLLAGKDGKDIVKAWQKGFQEDSYVPLMLSAVFDVPISGDNDPQTKLYEKCRYLEREMFVAVGRANCLGGTDSPLSSIRLDFLRLDVPKTSVASDDDRSGSLPKPEETVARAAAAQARGRTGKGGAGVATREAAAPDGPISEESGSTGATS